MPTRGPASSPAGVRKGGALSRAIARQNGKRPESAARARDSPASDTASFGGRSSPPSEKPGPVFQPPSRPPIGEPIGEKTGEIGLQKAKSVSVVLDEPSGSPQSPQKSPEARRMMKRAQTQVTLQTEEPSEVAQSPKRVSSPNQTDLRKRAMSVPAAPEDATNSSPLTADSLPKAPARRKVTTSDVVEQAEVEKSGPPAKQSDFPMQRRTALVAMESSIGGDSTQAKIKSLFGCGNRVDPKVWTAWVENLAHSGQSQPMAGHFQEVDHESIRAKQEIDKTHMELLTETHFLQDLQNETNQPSSVAGNPKERPTRPMSAAFTDRGVRLREGLATRQLLRMEKQSYEDPGPSKHKAGCGCTACQPFHVPAAGQPTHACTHNIVADPVKVKVGKHNYPQAQSPGVRKALEYAQGSCQDHELLFQQSMTRKGRVRADATSTANAEQYRRPKMEAMMKKSPEGGNPNLQRSDASFILNPRDTDPPHPHDRICNTRKARGEFKSGPSEECRRFAVKWNQDLYRFDVLAYGGDGIRPLYRAGSCPPNQGRNPITGDAGEGQDGYKSPRRKTEHEMKGRHTSGQGVRMVTNHSNLDAQAKEDRENRLAVDENFAKLCKAGVELGSHRIAEVSKIKATQHRQLSTNVANALRWDD
ncbi:unnamed protein product [Durusdinium trenchii]|uniref:Uncharacterized protein n=1 Tax=Durusdinium trenchii TaxID=1381693 RepID=A0ABP0N5Q6_9DINO